MWCDQVITYFSSCVRTFWNLPILLGFAKSPDIFQVLNLKTQTESRETESYVACFDWFSTLQYLENSHCTTLEKETVFLKHKTVSFILSFILQQTILLSSIVLLPTSFCQVIPTQNKQMEGFVMDFASYAVKTGGQEVASATTGHFWSRLPETLFHDTASIPAVKYGLVAAVSVAAVGATVVATKQVKDRKTKSHSSSPSPSIPYEPRQVHIPQVTPVPVFSENLKIDEETKLHYELFGRGPQKVLLLGGMAARLSLLESFISELLKHPEFQICAFDQRVSGLSTAKKQKLTSKIMAGDAETLLQRLGWDKVHVFGFSMGGCVATELALTVPQKISSLFLSATTAGRKYVRIPFGPMFYSVAFGGYLTMPKIRLVDILLSQHHSEKYLSSPAMEEDGLGGNTLSTQTVRDVLRNYFLENWDRLVSFNDVTVSSQCSVVSTHFVSDEQLKKLAGFGFPIVVQYNTSDPLDVGNSSAKRLCDNMKTPNCTALVFDGAGHFGIREEFTRFVASFLTNCAKSQCPTVAVPSS
jgi:pimeloyl-ACP methyl ester carboxylesterase